MMVTWCVTDMPAIALCGATVECLPDVIDPQRSLGVSQTCLSLHQVMPQFNATLMSYSHDTLLGESQTCLSLR